MTGRVDKSSTFEKCDPKEATRIRKTVLDEIVAQEVVNDIRRQFVKMGSNGQTVEAIGKEVMVTSDDDVAIHDKNYMGWVLLFAKGTPIFEKKA